MKKDKYIEDLGNGFVKILGGKTTYNKEYFKDVDFEAFKKMFLGKITTDITRTYELLTGKKASVKPVSPRRASPRVIKKKS